ncbi:hypothetical protein [Nocardia noduli]|uniref:hypothetical protein n=1 Tax=Nocardia noduli TaxID=2815722 RepID=UPI001C246503|nr:hypothetical protein [Nocardia noduli]
MTRSADRKARIRAYMATHPGTSYTEAARRLDTRYLPTRTVAAWTASAAEAAIPAPDPGGLGALLVTALRNLRDTAAAGPPVIRLARGRGALATAGFVSAQLGRHAIPARDNFETVYQACTASAVELAALLGDYLTRAHGLDPRSLLDTTSDPLLHYMGPDAEVLAAPMIILGGQAADLFTAIAEDESALPEHRKAAIRAADNALITWSHFGGDGAGW